MLIIPAIDIIEGRCVRLHQGDYEQKVVYSDAPADVACSFATAGLCYLHVVDLDGARGGAVANWATIEAIVRVPEMKIEVGGGIRTADDIRRLLSIGVDRVVVGSIAAKSPELVKYWLEEFGGERIAVGMDVRNNSVAVSGWFEDSRRGPVEFLSEMIRNGARSFICTDIERDGALQGANVEFFEQLRKAFPEVQIIASGGVTTADDLLALERVGVEAVIVGKALYEGKLRLEELTRITKIDRC